MKTGRINGDYRILIKEIDSDMVVGILLEDYQEYGEGEKIRIDRYNITDLRPVFMGQSVTKGKHRKSRLEEYRDMCLEE